MRAAGVGKKKSTGSLLLPEKTHLPVMISVLQFNTDAHRHARTHTNTDAESDEMMEVRGETGVEEK